VLGSPLVNDATLRVPGASKTFTIVPENNSDQNVYVQSEELNGKPMTRSWIMHEEIVAGGELRFRMGGTPMKTWGSAPADRPPSGLIPSAHHPLQSKK
jgi:putative alpha-1,2-mannosidase